MTGRGPLVKLYSRCPTPRRGEMPRQISSKNAGARRSPITCAHDSAYAATAVIAAREDQLCVGPDLSRGAALNSAEQDQDKQDNNN
jgi:hypothetical protein